MNRMWPCSSSLWDNLAESFLPLNDVTGPPKEGFVISCPDLTAVRSSSTVERCLRDPILPPALHFGDFLSLWLAWNAYHWLSKVVPEGATLRHVYGLRIALKSSLLNTGWSEVLVAQCPVPGDPMDYSPPGSSVHGVFQASILEWVAISYSRGSSSDPGIEAEALGSPALQEDSLPAEPPGKSSNTGLSAWIRVLGNSKGWDQCSYLSGQRVESQHRSQKGDLRTQDSGAKTWKRSVKLLRFS